MNLILFLTVLSTLVIAHEWGHYFVAKRFGITVHRFSIGFGPVLFRRKGKETEFCVSLIPLGGYVKLAGEDPKEATGDPGDFSSRPAWQRFSVVFAGPLLNAILAFAVFSGIYLAGNPVPSTLVGRVIEDFPAAKAGVLEGDRVLAIDGKEVKFWDDILKALRDNRADTMRFDVRRGGETLQLTIAPRFEGSGGLLVKKRPVGRIGIAPSGEAITVKTGVLESFSLGAKQVANLTGLILKSLGMLLTGQISFKESMTGPIGIYFLTEQAAKFGVLVLLSFAASLSVSLFVLNLLPIPVLDGGHLLFIVIESIIRRPVSERVKEKSMQVGLYFLLVVAVLVIYQDLVKYGFFEKIRTAIGL